MAVAAATPLRARDDVCDASSLGFQTTADSDLSRRNSAAALEAQTRRTATIATHVAVRCVDM